MKECVYSYCTSDCHECIKNIASIILFSAHGDTVFRELAKNMLNLDFIQILYAD
jgi:3-deoxy-D-manno-octulosonate 8-phosphate phosphatase KdsC-like HAD superfamily phosphatase